MLKTTTLIATTLVLGTSLAAQRGSAVYEVTFDSTWSRATHPVDFPSNPHYSPLIGGTHNSSVKFWESGKLATRGIEQMAETGSTFTLSQEIQAHINAGRANSVIRGGGIGNSPGAGRVRFTVNASHPEVTIVSMLAPSPDWFVGISGVSVIKNGQFIEKMTLPAFLYDSGTDSGVTYRSPNQNTNPAENIARIDTTKGPFKGLPGPIGTWTIQRVASGLAFGCGINPRGSMSINGQPLLGRVVRVGVHDPSSSMPRGSATFLYFGATPAGMLPCGIRVPGWGLNGGAGELLVTNLVTSQMGAMWQGMAVDFNVGVPNQPNLIGAIGYAQGVLASGNRIGLTEAAEFRIGR